MPIHSWFQAPVDRDCGDGEDDPRKRTAVLLVDIALRLTRARPAELAAALWSFVYFFAVLAAYYVLRPIRDEISMQVGPDALQVLFYAVTGAMLALVPAFGWLTRRFSPRRLLPWIYAFCALNLIVFFVAMRADGANGPVTARVFYVWVSVFNLFVVSVFWSFMADIFDAEQARRLYGFIAAGGTVGALAGPLLTSELVQVIGARWLMLVSAALLGLAMVAIARLRAWAHRNPPRAEAPLGAAAGTSHQVIDPGDADARRPMRGGLWSGIVDVVRTPYLLGICAFLFAYALLSTFLYFQTAQIMPRTIVDSAARTRLLARFDLAVNVAALLLQLLAFRPLMARLGLRFVLAALPAVSVIGFAVFARHPTLPVLLAFGLLRRSGEYALSKPARETLFNVIPVEQKYRAKNVIDTLVHRIGDSASASAFGGLRALGLTISGIAWLSVPLAAGWTAVALWLAGQAQRRGSGSAAIAVRRAP